MDGFGDNFDQTDVDPAAEFLAREKDQLAGLEDDVGLNSANTSNDIGETTVINSGMQNHGIRRVGSVYFIFWSNVAEFHLFVARFRCDIIPLKGAYHNWM